MSRHFNREYKRSSPYQFDLFGRYEDKNSCMWSSEIFIQILNRYFNIAVHRLSHMVFSVLHRYEIYLYNPTSVHWMEN